MLEYPPLIKANKVSGHMLVTTDLLPTIMELLGVSQPAAQRGWGIDGRSAVPAMAGQPAAVFNNAGPGRGWLFWRQPSALGGAFRHGKWKLVNQSNSCVEDCEAELYDLDADLGETTDLSRQHLDVFAAIVANMSKWKEQVINSALTESKCAVPFPPGPVPPHGAAP